MQSHDAISFGDEFKFCMVPTWVIEKLTLAELGMYTCISKHVKQGKASPSCLELSVDAKVTRKQVLRIIASLEAKGVIRCHRTAGQQNTYEVSVRPFPQQTTEPKTTAEEDGASNSNTKQYEGVSYFRTPVHWVRLLSPTELLVATTIGSYANKDLQCWPSIASIADRCNLSNPTVKRTISSLEEKGVISVLRRYGTRGGAMTNLYQINVKMGSSVK